MFSDEQIESLLGPPPACDKNGRPVYLSTQLAPETQPDNPCVELVKRGDMLYLRWLHDEDKYTPVLPEAITNSSWVVTTKPLTKENKMRPGSLENNSGFIVPAEVHSDDYEQETKFDALPWFQQASDEEIVALAKCEWGGDYPADAVAQHLSDSDPEIQTVLEWAEDHDGIGFECHVEEAAARKWIAENKPHLLPQIGDTDHDEE
jgi:hypothetical protein